MDVVYRECEDISSVHFTNVIKYAITNETKSLELVSISSIGNPIRPINEDTVYSRC